MDKIDTVLANYDASIITIARKVAGRNYGIIDDLAQIGRMRFLKLYPQNQRWAFLSKSIQNAMLTWAIENAACVGISHRSQLRIGLKPTSEELDVNLSTNDKNTADLDLIANLLHCIEADIEALPTKQRKSAKAYLRILSGEKNIKSKNGKIIVERLVQKYRKEATELLELNYDE